MATVKQQLQESKESCEMLLEEYLRAGSTVYALRRGGSSSGMTHYYTLLVAGLNNQGEPDLFNITYHAAKALGWKLMDRDGSRVIKVEGGGMDMGFHLVYSLSSVLFAGQDRAGYILNHRSL